MPSPKYIITDRTEYKGFTIATYTYKGLSFCLIDKPPHMATEDYGFKLAGYEGIGAAKRAITECIKAEHKQHTGE